jgi:hypothetical protein
MCYRNGVKASKNSKVSPLSSPTFQIKKTGQIAKKKKIKHKKQNKIKKISILKIIQLDTSINFYMTMTTTITII